MKIEYSPNYGYWFRQYGKALIDQSRFGEKVIFYDWSNISEAELGSETVAIWKVKLKTN